MSADNEIAVCGFSDGMFVVGEIRGCPSSENHEDMLSIVRQVSECPRFTTKKEAVAFAFDLAEAMIEDGEPLEYGITHWTFDKTLKELCEGAEKRK